MTRTMLNRRADSDIGHGRVFMSSCVYEFTLGERLGNPLIDDRL